MKEKSIVAIATRSGFFYRAWGRHPSAWVKTLGQSSAKPTPLPSFSYRFKFPEMSFLSVMMTLLRAEQLASHSVVKENWSVGAIRFKNVMGYDSVTIQFVAEPGPEGILKALPRGKHVMVGTWLCHQLRKLPPFTRRPSR